MNDDLPRRMVTLGRFVDDLQYAFRGMDKDHEAYRVTCEELAKQIRVNVAAIQKANKDKLSLIERIERIENILGINEG